MALEYTGLSTDQVSVATDASFEDQLALSFVMWLYLNTAADNSMYVRKNVKFLSTVFNTGADALFQVGRTSNAEARSVGFWETGKWLFVAATYDGTDGPRLWKGDLSSYPYPNVAEVSYSLRNVGSGTPVTDNANDLGIGNRVGTSFAMDGRIAHFQWINARFGLTDIRRQQFSPHVSPGCVIFQHLGLYGTTIVIDQSGRGNNGTVNGPTLAPHIPLPEFLGYRTAPPRIVRPVYPHYTAKRV